MKRNAFNLIELIFVIIILGILSTVVIVKIGYMTERTRLAKLKSFVGTLNRSVGPAIWFNSINNDRGGSIISPDYTTNINSYIELLPNYTSGPSLTNCNSTGDGIFLGYSYSVNYEIHCADGNQTTSPAFKLYNQTDNLYVE